MATLAGDPDEIWVGAMWAHPLDALGSWASLRPSGLLLISCVGVDWAFYLEEGRIMGGRGAGPLDDARAWISTFCEMHPTSVLDVDAAQTPRLDAQCELHRTFLYESMLGLFERGHAQFALIAAPFSWAGVLLPDTASIGLEHILLEYARRLDEMPKLLGRVGDLRAELIRGDAPPDDPSAGASPTDASGADFLLHPDAAARSEWEDARHLWRAWTPGCTGAQLVGHAMLGRFRGLAALATLLSSDLFAPVTELRAA